jgi:hypothetical protein
MTGVFPALGVGALIAGSMSGLFAGLHDVATRWVVTHDLARWDGEIVWMSLYFSAAVWTSLLLAGFGLMKHLLPRNRAGHPTPRLVQPPCGRSGQSAAMD